MLAQAAEILRAGGVVAIPTDSCYALGCRLGFRLSFSVSLESRFRLGFWFRSGVGLGIDLRLGFSFRLRIGTRFWLDDVLGYDLLDRFGCVRTNLG